MCGIDLSQAKSAIGVREDMKVNIHSSQLSISGELTRLITKQFLRLKLAGFLPTLKCVLVRRREALLHLLVTNVKNGLMQVKNLTFYPRRPTYALGHGRWRLYLLISKIAVLKSRVSVDRKMIINALNSGAKVFMADFEDSSSSHMEV